MSQVAEARAIRLLEAISDAFRTKDWRRLRSLYHDQARIVSVAAGERVLSPDELIEVLSEIEDASASYSTDEAKTRAFDDNAVVVSGVLRSATRSRRCSSTPPGFSRSEDGLVWRSMAFRSVDDARAGYEELGLDLGLS